MSCPLTREAATVSFTLRGSSLIQQAFIEHSTMTSTGHKAMNQRGTVPYPDRLNTTQVVPNGMNA